MAKMRPYLLGVRLNATEYAAIKKAAELRGETISEVARLQLSPLLGLLPLPLPLEGGDEPRGPS